MPYLLPDVDTVSNCTITFSIPNDPKWVAIIVGAIAQLAVETNWEAGSGLLSVNQAVDVALEIRESVMLSTDCNNVSITVVYKQAAPLNDCEYLDVFISGEVVIMDTIPTSAGFPVFGFTDVNGEVTFNNLPPATYRIFGVGQVATGEVVVSNSVDGVCSLPPNVTNLDVVADSNKEVIYGYR